MPSYFDVGFDSFLDRSISSAGQMINLENILSSQIGNSIQFDKMQISGSLGDKIQVGGSNVIIDGKNSRITISDGQVIRVLIGKGEF